MTDLLGDAGVIVEETVVSLSVQFSTTFTEDDHQDIAQEAYRKVLEAYRSGREIRSPLAMVKTTARNVALDRLRRGPPERAEDPGAECFVSEASERGPEAAILTRADLARGIEAAEQLPPAQQAVYRATVIDELEPVEAYKRLGMGRSTFFKYQRLAFAHVHSAQVGSGSPFAKAEYKLLSAYAFGVATARERVRAERLVRNDPHAAAALRELRNGHRVAAIALPALVITASRDLGVLDRFGELPGRVRDAVASLVGRSQEGAADAASGLAGSGAGRGAGVAGAGVLAKLGLSGPTVAACLTTGAAITACVATGVLPAPGLPGFAGGDEPDAAAVKQHAWPSHERVRAVVSPALLPSQVGHDGIATESTAAKKKSQGGGEDSGPTPASEPVVDATAPPVQQEFGVPSAATPVGGAPPDTNDSNGAAASTVREEFGP